MTPTGPDGEWIKDEALMAENRRLRGERRVKRMRAEAVDRAKAKIAVPHVGLAAYFTVPPSEDPTRSARIAELLVDRRWPWLPWWASYTAWDKRQDGTSKRVGGINGVTPLLATLARRDLMTLRLNRAAGRDNFTSVALSLDEHSAKRGDPLTLWITCKTIDLPKGKSFAEFLALAHELILAVGADHATLGAWPTYNQAIHDTWLIRTIVDTPRGDTNLGLPADFDMQMDLLAKWRHKVGRTYARHPRWGTYLHADHVAAIGGVEQIRAVVAPARIEAVGALTYVQLTESIDTALTPEAEHKRHALQALMTPILLGAPVPPPSAP